MCNKKKLKRVNTILSSRISCYGSCNTQYNFNKKKKQELKAGKTEREKIAIILQTILHN